MSRQSSQQRRKGPPAFVAMVQEWSGHEPPEDLQAVLERIHQLQRQGHDINAVDPATGNTALLTVCQRVLTFYTHEALLIELLLSNGADVNFVNHSVSPPMSPISCAVKAGNSPLVRCLLHNGADPSVHGLQPLLAQLSHSLELADTVTQLNGKDPDVESGPLATRAHASDVKRVLVEWFVKRSTATTGAKSLASGNSAAGGASAVQGVASGSAAPAPAAAAAAAQNADGAGSVNATDTRTAAGAGEGTSAGAGTGAGAVTATGTGSGTAAGTGAAPGLKRLWYCPIRDCDCCPQHIVVQHTPQQLEELAALQQAGSGAAQPISLPPKPFVRSLTDAARINKRYVHLMARTNLSRQQLAIRTLHAIILRLMRSTRKEDIDDATVGVAVRSHLEVALDPRCKGQEGRGPLATAASMEGGRADVVVQLLRLLVSKGASVDERDFNGMTALSVAVRLARLEVVKELLKLGADPNASDVSGTTPLHSAAGLSEQTEVLQALLDSGRAQVTQATICGSTALHTAAHRGNDVAVRALLSQGANVNARTRAGNTPLMSAAKFMEHSIAAACRELIDAGADVNARNHYGFSALHLALSHPPGPQVLDTVRLLLAAGADAQSPAGPPPGEGVLSLWSRSSGSRGGPSDAVHRLLSQALKQANGKGAPPAPPARSQAQASEAVAAALLAEEEAERAKAQAEQAKRERKKKKKKGQSGAEEGQGAGEQEAAGEEAAGGEAGAGAAQPTGSAGATGGLACGTAGASSSSGSSSATQDATNLGQHEKGAVWAGSATPGQAAEASTCHNTGISALATSVQQTSFGHPQNTQGGAAAAHADDERFCVVCMEAARCVALVPCGHVVLCQACSEAVQAKRNECPMCRQTIEAAVLLTL